MKKNIDTELDTSWFDLKNYGGLNKFDLPSLHRQIAARQWLKSIIDSEEIWLDKRGEDFQGTNKEWLYNYCPEAYFLFERLKVKPIIEENPDDPWHVDFISDSHFSLTTGTIRNITAHELHTLGTHDGFDRIWEYSNNVNDGFPISEEQVELLNTPFDILCIQEHGTRFSYYNEQEAGSAGSEELDFDPLEGENVINNGWLAHLTVDVSATDKQLVDDFTYWLAKYRKATNFEAKKISFNQVSIEQHIKNYRILQYIDLTLIAKIEGIDIKNRTIKELMFSDSMNPKAKNIADLFDKSTIPSAKRAMKKETLWAFEAHIRKKILALCETQLVIRNYSHEL